MADLESSGIYEIVNTVNGKRYVGSAVNFRIRWNGHRLRLRGGYHHSPHLQSSWNLHGEDAFEFKVIEECEPDILIEREQFHIDSGCEYNVCRVAGSTLGYSHTQETKDKISAIHTGRKMPPRSAEYREKMSAIHKGKTLTPEHMAAFQAGRAARIFTDEQRENISEKLTLAYAEGKRSRERPPEYREKIAATLRELSKSTDVRDRLSKQASDAWGKLTQEERASRVQKLHAGRKPMTQEQRQAISDRQAGKPMLPNVAAALLAANVGKKQDPASVSVRAAKNKEWWTPERREKRSAEMRERHARRKAESQNKDAV